MTDLRFLRYGMPDFRHWEAKYGTPACVNAEPDVFFPEQGDTASEAKAICSRCPCVQPCLEYALGLPTADDFGVFGGTTTKERERLRRRNVPTDGVRRCVVDGCARPHDSRGFCMTHYRRMKRGSDLYAADEPTLPVGPLVDALHHRGVSFASLGATDSRALHRAQARGNILESIADRIAVRALRLTVDEVYGWQEAG